MITITFANLIQFVIALLVSLMMVIVNVYIITLRQEIKKQTELVSEIRLTKQKGADEFFAELEAGTLKLDVHRFNAIGKVLLKHGYTIRALDFDDDPFVLTESE